MALSDRIRQPRQRAGWFDALVAKNRLNSPADGIS